MKRFYIFCSGILLLALLTGCQPFMPEGSASGVEMAPSDDNILLGIINAPTTPGGIVADLPTSTNVLMNAPGTDNQYASDPAAFGHQIPAGGWMEIEFGGTYVRNGVDNDVEFVPINSNTTLILLDGNPQNAIVAAMGDGPQHGNYSVEDDGDKIITIRPNGGEGDMGLEGERAQKIGLKTIHLTPTFGSPAGPHLSKMARPAAKEPLLCASTTLPIKCLSPERSALSFPLALGRRSRPSTLAW